MRWALNSRLRVGVRTYALLMGALLVAAAATHLWATVAMTRTIVDFFILVSIVVGLQTFVGSTGIVSFGHAAFFGVGAYAAAIVSVPPGRKDTLTALPGSVLELELGLAPTLLVAVIVSAVVASVVAAPLSRMTEPAMAMATLAILVLFHTTFVNWTGLTRGTRAMVGIPRLTTLWVAVAVSALVVGVAVLYRASAHGLRVQAAREDPVAARALGINVSRERFISFVLSATLTGLGGAVWALNSLSFGPDSFFFSETFARLSMLVIGGLFSVTGAVAGVALVITLEEWVANVDQGIDIWFIHIERTEGIVQLAVASTMLLMLLFRPIGVLGTSELGGWMAESAKRSQR